MCKYVNIRSVSQKNQQIPLHGILLPKEENIRCDGEVPLVVDHDDAILGEGKVCVTLPAAPILLLLLAVFLGVVTVLRGQHNGPDILSTLAVKHHDPALVRYRQKVAWNDK